MRSRLEALATPDEGLATRLHARERCTTVIDVRVIAPLYGAIFEDVGGH